MSSITAFMISHAWAVIPILALVFYKFTLRVFFGMVIVPENKIGLVTKKFVLFGPNSKLPDGKIIATKGEAGFQASTLAPGLYWGFWVWQFIIDLNDLTVVPMGKIGLVSAKDGQQLAAGSILANSVQCDNFQDALAFLDNKGQRGKQCGYLNNGTFRINTHLFNVELVDVTSIEDGYIGILTALDGAPLSQGNIAGPVITNHNNFQDFDKFLTGNGQRGLQEQTIQAGNYLLNTWAVKVEKVKMTEIPIGYVGVVISFVGEEGIDTSGTDFKHGNIVIKGQKGVWATPLDPGKYALNRYTMRIEQVPTTNLVLNWANARTEAHALDKNLCTITVRSKDGFPFNLDVSQIIHIPANEAPKVIARFGSISNLVSQVLEPTIGNYFRNSAQNNDIISFLNDRKERQDSAKTAISTVLDEYNVHAVDTLIGDIVPPAELMKTLTDRKIAMEQESTYIVECKAQDQRKMLESAKSLADMQGQMVNAQQSVEISQRMAEAAVKKSEGAASAITITADAEAKATVLRANAAATEIELLGNADATKIAAIGKATADAYTLQVQAMGQNNFAQFKITESIGANNIKLMPDVLITGVESGGPMNGLLGLKLLENMDLKNKDTVAKTTKA